MFDYKKIKIHIKNVIRLGIIIYFLTIVCFYFSSIIPFKRQLVQLEQKKKVLKEQVDQLESQYMKKWEDEEEEVFTIINSFREKEGEKDLILSEFFKMSNESGIEINKTEPMEDEILGDTMIRYSWNISCNSNYPAMGAFFNRIERSPLFLCVESPSIQSGEKIQKQRGGTPVEQIKDKVEFLLSTYRFKE